MGSSLSRAWWRSMTTSQPEIPSASTMKNHFCQPPASAQEAEGGTGVEDEDQIEERSQRQILAEPEARQHPGLGELVERRSPPPTGRASQPRLGRGTWLARAEQVGAAAAAQFGMFRRRAADVGAPMPAARALGVWRWRGDHRRPRPDRWRLHQGGLRADQHEAAGRRPERPAVRTWRRWRGSPPRPAARNRCRRPCAVLRSPCSPRPRTSRMRMPACRQSSASPACAGSSCQVPSMTLSPIPPLAASCHISSAVKARIGAISRVSVCTMCHSALCAERRAREFVRRGVEAVLEDVEVEGAEILGAEALQRLHHLVELEALVVGDALLLQLARQRQRVAVDLQPFARPAACRWPDRSRRCWRAGT